MYICDKCVCTNCKPLVSMDTIYLRMCTFIICLRTVTKMPKDIIKMVITLCKPHIYRGTATKHHVSYTLGPRECRIFKDMVLDGRRVRTLGTFSSCSIRRKNGCHIEMMGGKRSNRCVGIHHEREKYEICNYCKQENKCIRPDCRDIILFSDVNFKTNRICSQHGTNYNCAVGHCKTQMFSVGAPVWGFRFCPECRDTAGGTRFLCYLCNAHYKSSSFLTFKHESDRCNKCNVNRTNDKIQLICALYSYRAGFKMYFARMKRQVASEGNVLERLLLRMWRDRNGCIKDYHRDIKYILRGTALANEYYQDLSEKCGQVDFYWHILQLPENVFRMIISN